jgi:DDE superfamily endonuclease
VDHQSRPGICPKKSWRDRLITLAQRQPDWLVGFEDEVWWSRVRQPHLASWSPAGEPLRLVEQTVAKKTKRKDAVKALACYGLLARWQAADGTTQEGMWLRFVDGRPISAVTTQFLAWCCQQVADQGQRVLVLVWDNASWHSSAEVRTWVHAHNRAVKATGQGVRLLVCALPSKSPWLNPIEPKWVHGKQCVVEPAGLLSPAELEDRICATYHCAHEAHLTMPEKVA